MFRSFDLNLVSVWGIICFEIGLGIYHPDFIIIPLPGSIEAWGVFITGVFTVVLAVSTIGLWNETSRLSRGAERQGIDFQRSIEIAAKANEIANSALVVDQRPWLNCKVKKSGKIFSDGETIYVPISITIKNCGKTPVPFTISDHSVIMDGNAAIIFATEKSFDFKNMSTIKIPHVAFPGDEVEIEFVHGFDHKELNLISPDNKAYAICSYIRISYNWSGNNEYTELSGVIFNTEDDADASKSSFIPVDIDEAKKLELMYFPSQVRFGIWAENGGSGEFISA